MKANKTFVRVDFNGNVIPGTMINVPKKPIDGRWKEIKDNTLCCSPFVLISKTMTLPFSIVWPAMSISCTTNSARSITQSTDGGDANITSMDALVEFCNNEFSTYGRFYSEGSILYLKLKKEIADILACPGGNITLDIYDNN